MKAPGTGWSRAWPGGAPHYFVQGDQTALCNVPVMNHPLTLTPLPDSDRPQAEQKQACPECQRKAGRLQRGMHR